MESGVRSQDKDRRQGTVIKLNIQHNSQILNIQYPTRNIQLTKERQKTVNKYKTEYSISNITAQYSISNNPSRKAESRKAGEYPMSNITAKYSISNIQHGISNVQHNSQILNIQ